MDKLIEKRDDQKCSKDKVLVKFDPFINRTIDTTKAQLFLTLEGPCLSIDRLRDVLHDHCKIFCFHQIELS